MENGYCTTRNLESIELLKVILRDIAKDKNIFRRRLLIDNFLRKLCALT